MEVECESKYALAYAYLSTLVHFVGCTNFATAVCLRLYYDLNHPKPDFYMKFGYSFKYVSMLNAVGQMIYNFIALVVDIMIICSYTLDAPPIWLKVRSFVRSAIAIPNGFYSCVTFWVMLLYRVKLLGDYSSNWMRHMVHTANPIILLFDLIFCKGESTGIITSLIVINIPCTLYFIWVHIIYQFTGIWAVIFMKNLTLLERLLVYIGHTLEHYLWFLIGKFLNDILWDEDFVLRIPLLRRFVKEPPRFLFGKTSKDSSNFKKLLSRTESIFVDRPLKKKVQKPVTQK